MSKRLILILTLAFLVGITCAAYAEVQNVKVSGDIDVLGIGRDMSLLPHISQNKSTVSTMATITRVKIDADLTDNVSTTVRLLNERYWGSESENNNANGHNTDIQLDLASVSLREFLYSPLSLTIGRQELHFGNDMIVGDYDTNNVVSTASAFTGANKDADLSARKAFDAIRATLNYDPLVVDVVAAQVTQPNLVNIVGTATNTDVKLLGVNAGYKLNKDTLVEGYWFEKRTGLDNNVVAKAADIVDNIGGRITTVPMKDLKFEAEAAYQFGKYVPTVAGSPPNHTVVRKAWAAETSLAYDLKKVKYTPSLKALYAYFSGDHELNLYDTSMGAYRGWDPMFENQTIGHVYNALFNQTNAHILGGIVSAKPFEDVTLKGEYYAYWLAKAYPDVGNKNGATPELASAHMHTARSTAILYTTQRRDLGQELDITATYDYTEDVQFSLLSGTFFPGRAFSKENDSVATELIGSMKVTF